MNQIKEIAVAKKMSLSEIVRKTEVSRSFLYSIIKENSYPTIPTAKKIAAALGVTLNELFPIDTGLGGDSKDLEYGFIKERR